jgi:hypothetical protein
MDLILPFRILVSPLRTFKQLAQRPAAKGLITLFALVFAITAAAQYASATRIWLTINNVSTSFLQTGNFTTWFAASFSTSILYTIMYWFMLTIGLVLISKTLKGKDTGLRNSFVAFGYLLSVFVVLYAVRALMYLALPSIQFQTDSWPPMSQTAVDDALILMAQSWGPLFAYQFGSYFTLVSLAWLVILGMIAVKTMREVSWVKASIVSVVASLITVFLLQLP